jgi:hypothetical protein
MHCENSPICCSTWSASLGSLMLTLIVITTKERAVPQQQDLFAGEEPTWAERLRESLDANTRRQIVTVLAEMMRAAVQSPSRRNREYPAMKSDQITAVHYARGAYVYIRQSSTHQVLHHTESQQRQRDHVQRAVALGWSPEQVVVIDEDLGQSAARSGRRSGFEQLLADVAIGKAGLILSLEVSRISRANRNWYHLLDICAITETLIGDSDGLYDPRAYNDRLLLGLKGTLSEAELYVMKQRLVEAVHSKA